MRSSRQYYLDLMDQETPADFRVINERKTPGRGENKWKRRKKRKKGEEMNKKDKRRNQSDNRKTIYNVNKIKIWFFEKVQ